MHTYAHSVLLVLQLYAYVHTSTEDTGGWWPPTSHVVVDLGTPTMPNYNELTTWDTLEYSTSLPYI